MNRKILGLIVAIALSVAMYFSWQHFKHRYSNQEIAKTNLLLSEMEQKGIPAFELPNLKGEFFSSEQMRGKLVFINFWASWCDPCVREFPSMLSLVKHFKGELLLIAISNDENKEDMESFIKAFEADIPGVHILWDPERKVSELYGTYKLPETFMVGPDLKLIRKIVGIEKWYTPGSIEYISDVIQSYKK